MTIPLQDFIESTSSITNTSDLLDLYLRVVEDAGYQNAMFARTGGHQLQSVLWDRLPVGYLDHYTAFDWEKIDPILQHAQSARLPFRWSDLVGRVHLTNRQRAFLNESRELGVHSGVTLPLHGPGTEVDVISLSMRDHPGLVNDRLKTLHAASVQYWLRFGELNDRPRRTVPRLTEKELECLRWCKEGKTNWEIGEITSTSEKTVEFHLSNAIRKLGACNRLTAVVIGIQCGLISL
jgi:DNA-binding CsgD family transcriptional regulator